MKLPLRLLPISSATCLTASLFCLILLPSAKAEWTKHVIVSDAKTSINSAVANDVNGDGHLDVIATYGSKSVLHLGPDWKQSRVLYVYGGKPLGNSAIHSCLLDADGDGDLDYCVSNRRVYWLECPADPLQGAWALRPVDYQIRGSHCLLAGDVDGDGKQDLIANSFQGPEKTTVPYSITWLKAPKSPQRHTNWVRHVFADGDAPGGNHYMGIGDVNGDGKPDISCGAKGGPGFDNGEWFAWWEQPKDGSAPWKKHLLSDKQPGASNIEPADLNGDGKVDFLASRGHGQGILWFKAPEFTEVIIDPDIIRPHSLVVQDLDGDGDIDGAACGSQKDGVAAWYENDGKGNFTRHVVAKQKGSYDMRAYDMDGDGDLDFLIAGHGDRDIVWFERED